MTPSRGLDLSGPEAGFDEKSKTGLWVSQSQGAHGETSFLEVFPQPFRLGSRPRLPAQGPVGTGLLRPLGVFLCGSGLTVVSRLPVGGPGGGTGQGYV